MIIMKIDAESCDCTPQDDVINLDDCLVEYRQEHLESYRPRKNSGETAVAESNTPLAASPETLTTREAIDKFFCRDGLLKAATELAGRPYEYRKQQQLMAQAIVKSLQTDKNLCVEAPTGVGKSFAYLVPLIYTAKFRKHPALISTATITLQEQLINKDLPVLEKITGEKIKFVLAKGRGNYVCLRRLAMLTDDRRDSLVGRPSLTAEIQRIYTLQQEKNYGEREEFGFQTDMEAWSMVCCEGGNCMGQKCRFMKNCHYWKRRREWENADIIVANHALFFTDLKIRAGEEGDALLPAYDAVVLDEAHTLENDAAERMGLHLSSRGFNGFMNRLYNPDYGRGLLVRGGGDTMNLRQEVAEIKEHAKLFFDFFENYLNEHKENILRVTTPDSFVNMLSHPLIKFRTDLSLYAEGQSDKEFKTELEAQVALCDEILDSIDLFIGMQMKEAVYWLESNDGVSLKAAPLNVPELLRKNLFSKKKSVILVSATLTVDNKFDYFIRRTGFKNGESLMLDSPFATEQVKIYIPSSMPEPSHENYNSSLSLAIPDYLDLTHGKAFVLFTSYQQMRNCAKELEQYFVEKGINLLVQGEKLTRSAMIRQFKEDIDSVIFGTDSFWTGVDVPGEALSNVIITKLPFAVPSHPLIAARGEQIEQNGGNSFMDYSLPEAILKFRQGVGRLIRSRSDSGIIVILDKRVLSKRYGKRFLNSIPSYEVLVE